MSADTIASRLQERGKAHASAAAYHHKVHETWKPVSWGEYANHVRQAGRALIALGLEVEQPESFIAYLGLGVAYTVDFHAALGAQPGSMSWAGLAELLSWRG